MSERMNRYCYAVPYNITVQNCGKMLYTKLSEFLQCNYPRMALKNMQNMWISGIIKHKQLLETNFNSCLKQILTKCTASTNQIEYFYFQLLLLGIFPTKTQTEVTFISVWQKVINHAMHTAPDCQLICDATNSPHSYTFPSPCHSTIHSST